jgi:hypothetical protein
MVVTSSRPAPHPTPRANPLQRLEQLAAGLADALNHTFGNPREEGAHLPPLVGVQPYRDRPRRRFR